MDPLPRFMFDKIPDNDDGILRQLSSFLEGGIFIKISRRDLRYHADARNRLRAVSPEF
jgi:hypothetical protein